MTDALLATFALLPDGEPGGSSLVEALAARGVDAAWACWDDPDVDWAAADLVAVRATWDYHRRYDEFIGWVREVEGRTTVLNGADVFAWNADKAYLVQLGRHVPVVPTHLLQDPDLRAGLQAAIDLHGATVVKSRLGAAGLGVVIAEHTEDERLAGLAAGPWIVQPLVESVRTEGETSVFVIAGQVVSQVQKLPGGDEIRVHEQYGGRSTPVRVEEEDAELARRAVAGAEMIVRRTLDYARVDMLRLADGTLAVSELELIEPGLYLDVLPGNAQPFADLVAETLSRA